MSATPDATSAAPDGGFTTVIGPRRSLLAIDLAELWRYRDLVLLLTRRDIVTVYAQTVLGPLWVVLQPLITTFTFALVFGKAAGLAPPGMPGPLFYMSGLVPWFFFSSQVTKTSRTLTGGAHVMTKVYFPRLVMPISTTLSNGFTFLVQLAALAVMVAGYVLAGGLAWSPGPQLLGLPLLVLLMGALGLGTGILISAATTKYRDLSFLVGFGVQLLMYASPVILPLSRLQKFPTLLRVFELNPMTAVIEAFRAMLFGGAVPWGGLTYSAAVTAVMLLVGVMTFNKVERSFADIV
ncbi:MAG: ABC transporter permease [Flavobacteriales bacterium]|nr:Teichoic acid translocation permease protein TagG [Flavobacteriales bacterium]MCC6576470.1 ABC transporter permease [Flavobacteriales bacterium]NUQ16292.1 ABC transporter permease [Flavobacteriales bacterium]